MDPKCRVAAESRRCVSPRRSHPILLPSPLQPAGPTPAGTDANRSPRYERTPRCPRSEVGHKYVRPASIARRRVQLSAHSRCGWIGRCDRVTSGVFVPAALDPENPSARITGPPPPLPGWRLVLPQTSILTPVAVWLSHGSTFYLRQQMLPGGSASSFAMKSSASPIKKRHAA